MFRKGKGRGQGGVFLADADVFFFYLKGGRYEDQAESVIKEADAGNIALRTSSEVYDDAISAIRADGAPLSVAQGFVSDMKSIAHVALPMSAEVAEEALALYSRYGGRRELSYFDSFHLATAKRYALTMLTSDLYVIKHASTFGIDAENLSLW